MVISFRDSFFYTLGIIVVGFLCTLPYSLLPAHNIIQFPEFRYEVLFHVALSEILANVMLCLIAGYVLNINLIKRPRKILILSLVGNFVQLLFVIVTYVIWTQPFLRLYRFGYQYSFHWPEKGY